MFFDDGTGSRIMEEVFPSRIFASSVIAPKSAVAQTAHSSTGVKCLFSQGVIGRC